MYLLFKLISLMLMAFLPIHGHAPQIDSEASEISFRIGNMRISNVGGTFSLNRLDYNVGERVSTFLVSNPVEVTIRSVLVP